MDYHEKREYGRIRVSQPLILRAGKNANQSYKAVAVDVAEENIGIETEARLSLGEPIQLELVTMRSTIAVQAVVRRIFQNKYGCKFLEDDYGKMFSYYAGKSLNPINDKIK